MFSNDPFVVAEMSGNHLGSLDRALAIVDAAAEAGADAVKLQTFTPEQMVGDPNYVLTNGPWIGRNLLELYRETHTPREWHEPIFDRCKDRGIVGFSAPFHVDDLQFLESIGCPIYKIASPEITDLDLIDSCATTGKPLIISTSITTSQQIRDAVWAARNAWNNFVLLLCVPEYPASLNDFNLLQGMNSLRAFIYQDAIGYVTISGCRVGLSDHSSGWAAAAAATALGASVIEKHFTLSRSDGGPDAAFSMEPAEFAEMVKLCRQVRTVIGEYSNADCRPCGNMRRSLWFSKPLKRGDVITMDAVKVARPYVGLPPSFRKAIIGKTVSRDVESGSPVLEECLDANH